MSIKQIKAYLRQHSNQHVCGRFSLQQFDYFNESQQQYPSPNNLFKWGLAALLTTALVQPNYATTFNLHHKYAQIDVMHDDVAILFDANIMADTIVVSDLVKDTNNLPVAGIFVMSGKFKAQTNEKGEFVLRLPKSNEKVNLNINAHLYYLQKVYTIKPSQNRKGIHLILLDNQHLDIMGDVEYIPDEHALPNNEIKN